MKNILLSILAIVHLIGGCMHQGSESGKSRPDESKAIDVTGKIMKDSAGENGNSHERATGSDEPSRSFAETEPQCRGDWVGTEEHPRISSDNIVGQRCGRPQAFELYISNQSLSIEEIDITVRIDGQLVVEQYFNVYIRLEDGTRTPLGYGHNEKCFEFRLCPGEHVIEAQSRKGDAAMKSCFKFTRKTDYGRLEYFYSNDKQSFRPKSFYFQTGQGHFR